MKNTMICDKEREALEQIFKGVNKFAEAHNHIGVENLMGVLEKASEAEKAHILLYIDLVKDFIQIISALRGLLEVDEQEFIDIVTEHGKRSLKDVTRDIMMDSMMNIIMNEHK